MLCGHSRKPMIEGKATKRRRGFEVVVGAWSSLVVELTYHNPLSITCLSRGGVVK